MVAETYVSRKVIHIKERKQIFRPTSTLAIMDRYIVHTYVLVRVLIHRYSVHWGSYFP